MPTTKDDDGKVLTRAGVCTGFVVGGREFGIMASSVSDMQMLADILGVSMVKGRCKRGVWVRGEYFDSLKQQVSGGGERG